MTMDDAFLRAVSALQANLKLLDSQQSALSDFQDMQALRRLKTELADYIEGHAEKGELPPDPLATVGLRLEALKRFFQESESESQRLLDWRADWLKGEADDFLRRDPARPLLDWRADWLKGIPHVGLDDLQQAKAELAELEKQVPGIQGTLRSMLDPRDWDMSGNQPILHPELLICAETMPHMVPPSPKTCAALHEFAYGTGKRHEQVRNHLSNIGKRIDELRLLHDDHLSKLAEAENHLTQENFRSAEEVIGTLGKGQFADIVYSKAELCLKKQMVLFGRFAALKSDIHEKLARGEVNAVCTELDALRLLERMPNSELAAETSKMLDDVREILESYKRDRMRRHKRRRTIILTVVILMIASGAALTNYLIQEDKWARQAAAVAEAKAKREATKAKARAERDAAEATAKAAQEAVEAKAKADKQAAEAKAKLLAEISAGRVGVTLGVPLEGKAVMQFAFCPSGDFTMGSPTSEEGHKRPENQVSVTLSKGFWMATTEVTQAQWQAVMGNNPSSLKGDDLPVESVSWDSAQEFIKKVNGSGAMPSGWKCALPTEAQWEYACRAGETGPYSGGTIEQVAWYDGNSASKIHDVGTKKANAWGLHDMHGNVWEWCADWYNDTLPGGTDPSGPSSGVDRVLRGGSWNSLAARCRAASRLWIYPDYRLYFLGFRPALVPSK